MDPPWSGWGTWSGRLSQVCVWLSGEAATSGSSPGGETQSTELNKRDDIKELQQQTHRFTTTQRVRVRSRQSRNARVGGVTGSRSSSVRDQRANSQSMKVTTICFKRVLSPNRKFVWPTRNSRYLCDVIKNSGL